MQCILIPFFWTFVSSKTDTSLMNTAIPSILTLDIQDISYAGVAGVLLSICCLP